MELETLLLEIPETHVFKIPPRATAAGHKAEEWEGNHIWTGRCKVVAKGDRCEVKLEDPTTGELFAACPVNTSDPTNKTIEPVTDSSRYFVLRIEDDQGRHAFIGMGFTERSQAFDFNVAISDFKNQVTRQKQATSGQIPDAPHVDYSLKQGEKIRVDLKGKNKTEVKTPSAFQQALGIAPPTTTAAATGAPGIAGPPVGGLAPIAPPPGGKKSAWKQQQGGAPTAPAPAGFGIPAPAPVGTAAPAPGGAAPAKVDDFDDLFK